MERLILYHGFYLVPTYLGSLTNERVALEVVAVVSPVQSYCFIYLTAY